MYLCIDLVTCAYVVVERGVMGNDDKCSGLVFRHSAACFCDFVRLFACRNCVLGVSSKYPVEEFLALGAAHVSVSESYEESSYFWLEDDNKREHTHVENHVHDGGHESHVECTYYHSDHVKRYDGHEDAHCRSSAYPPEENEDDQAEQYYVENIRDG